MRRWVAFGVCASFAAVASCAVLAPLDDVNTSELSGDAGGQQCTKSAECTAANADIPHRCLEGRCVRIVTDDCAQVMDGRGGQGDVNDDNALFLGAFADATSRGLGAEYLNYRLALQELSGSTTGGLPGPNASTRPLVLVVCDNHVREGEDASAKIQANLAHLIDTVRVPGVIAAMKLEDLRASIEVATRKQVFLLSPYGSNEAMLRLIQDKSMLWHMLGVPADLALGYTKLVPKVEQNIRAARGSDGDVRVLALTSAEAFDRELTAAVMSQLVVNGRPAAEPDADFKIIEFAPGEDPAARATEISAFKPELIISLTGAPFHDSLFGAIERQLISETSPSYIFSPLNAGALATVIQPAINASIYFRPGSEKRFYGVNVAGAEGRDLYNAYMRRLRVADANARDGTENYYDAMYFLSYAVHAGSPRSTPTGPTIAAGIQRLLHGPTPIDVGPTGVVDALSALDDPQGGIRLNGTLGPPDFDVARRVRRDVAGIFCFGAQQQDSGPELTAKVFHDVMRISRETGELVLSSSYTKANAPCMTELLDP